MGQDVGRQPLPLEADAEHEGKEEKGAREGGKFA